MGKEERFNGQALVRYVLSEIRGRATQKEMSTRLGYRFNQWHKWESGQKVLMWADLVRIAEVMGLPLTDAVHVLAGPAAAENENGGFFMRNIFRKFGGYNLSQVQKKMRISKTTMHRLVTAQQDVPVTFVFEFLMGFSSMLPYLIGVLAPQIQDPIFKKEIARMRSQLRLESEFPWLSAIEAYLETEEYRQLKRHSDRAVAMGLGLSMAEVRQGMSLLLENRTIERLGDKYILSLKRVDLEADIVGSAKFARYWTEKALQRYSTTDGVPSSRRGWSSRVFPVSETARDELRKLTQSFIGEMANILLQDGKREKSRVQVFLMHFFDHQEFKNRVEP